MVRTKENLYSASQLQLAKVCKALAHPARVAIIQHLIKVDSCICGDIVEEVGLAQATISQHLKALKEAGVIKGTVEGASVCYCIDQNNWIAMQTLVTSFLNQQSHIDKDCC